MERSPTLEALRRALLARYPVTLIVTPEEERAVAALAEVAKSGFSRPLELITWTVTEGLKTADGNRIKDTEAPLLALEQVGATEGAFVFLFKDLGAHFEDPKVVRKLRDVRQRISGRACFLFLSGVEATLPRALRRDVAVVELPLAGRDELEPLLDRVLTRRKLAAPTGHLRDEMITALRGLTLAEAEGALNLVLQGRTLNPEVVSALMTQKAHLAKKSGVLEFVPRRFALEDVGGLPILKDWLLKRKAFFEDDRPESLALAPGGVLVMGVPGCGKSLSVKAISALWGLPLFRLDMAQVFSHLHGAPEEAFDRALKTMESVSPAILWIDEIENGISAESTGADAGIKGRIFATFLTWMQEKSARVFVAATANRIDLLPAELLRKGRFDQVFFIDLPSEDERAEIFKVHLSARGLDAAALEPRTLALATKLWNGAEIEQGIVSAMVEARAEGVALTKQHLFFQIGRIVPLATTMDEQIKAIRSWAHKRALRAS